MKLNDGEHKKKICPFMVDENGLNTLCFGGMCMAWVNMGEDLTLDEKGDIVCVMNMTIQKLN